MKVKFHGIKVNTSSGGGCSKCGGRSGSKKGFHTSWTFHLQGRSVLVRKGEVIEVSAAEAKDLLIYNGADLVFEVVNDEFDEPV